MNLHLVSSLVLVLIVIVYLLVYSQNLYQEGFSNDDGDFPSPSYCGDCNRRGKKGMNACLSCNNCGWCVDPNGYGSCVLGDYNGPYFADCSQYMYNGGISAFSGPPGGGGPGPGVGGGPGMGPNAPYGPAVAPWYQMLFVPWYGGFGTGSINASAPYMGNSFYNNQTPLKSERRWRPTGELRKMDETD